MREYKCNELVEGVFANVDFCRLGHRRSINPEQGYALRSHNPRYKMTRLILLLEG
jgi:hypothetical protein